MDQWYRYDVLSVNNIYVLVKSRRDTFRMSCFMNNYRNIAKSDDIAINKWNAINVLVKRFFG